MSQFAVLFDLNGTLADTEQAFFLAYQEVLLSYDIKFSIEQFTNNWSIQGKKLPDFLQSIAREDLLIHSNDMLQKKDQIFQETIEQRITPITGSARVVRLLHEALVPLGLDSSTTANNIARILKTLGLEQFFPHFSSGDMHINETQYGKVNRKAARLAFLAEQLAYPPEQCIVVGDAEKDIQGAKECRMKCIAVPNRYTAENDFSAADSVYPSFQALSLESFAQLL